MPPSEPEQPSSGDDSAFLHALLVWCPLPPARPPAPPAPGARPV